MDRFCRTALLLGKDAMARLAAAKVVVFGLGGVGGSAAEALVRGGIGEISLFDHDIVSESNINRQIFATEKTVGQLKTDAAKSRLNEINSDAKINAFNLFYSAENSVDLSRFNYIIDAIDTVPSKIELIVNASKSGVPIISSMGAGNKLNPAAFEVCDIYKTSVCPLARILRHELAARGVRALKVVYSKEPPVCAGVLSDNSDKKKRIPASISFVPPVVGLILAGECIKDIAGIKG